MANKHMKKYSTSLGTGEMQTKTLRWYFTYTRMTILKYIYITSVREDVEKSESSHVAGGNVKWYSHCGKQSDKSLKS